MKNTLALLFVPFSFLLSVLPVSADEEQTPLEESMSEMNQFYKKIRKTDDPVLGAEMARKAQGELIKGLVLIPALTKKQASEERKVKDVADYKRLMASTYVTFCEVELAFLNKDLDKVQELIGNLRKLKKEGHQKYIEE